MKPILAVAVLAAIALSGAGCQATSTTSGSAPTAARWAEPSQSPSRSPAVSIELTANTVEVCATVKKIDNDQTARYVIELTRRGPAETIKAPKDRAAIVAAAKKVLSAWAAALRVPAKKALDRGLKNAIGAKASALDKAAAVVTRLEDVTTPPGAVNSPAMNTATDGLNAACRF